MVDMPLMRWFWCLLFGFSMIGDRDASDDYLLWVAGKEDMQAYLVPSADHSDRFHPNPNHRRIKGALLTTHFDSYEQLASTIEINFYNPLRDTSLEVFYQPMVCLTHISDGKKVCSILKAGIDESHFFKAKYGSFWDKAGVGLWSPYAVLNSGNLMRVSLLARRRHDIFGSGDVAFFDFAEQMEAHISQEDLKSIDPRDLTEKGYLNAFNHITAQAFLTTLFSERLADFLADVHERYNMKELISGKFSAEQIADIENGPVDNYVDMINNEWGQELGKSLKKKYKISRRTVWTPELLSQYLNDIQRYLSWAFQIGFKPFSPEDEVVRRFVDKMHQIDADVFGIDRVRIGKLK